MTQKHFPPMHGEKQFHCIFCNVYASQFWSNNAWLKFEEFSSSIGLLNPNILRASYCNHCKNRTLWLNKKFYIQKLKVLFGPLKKCLRA